MDRRRRPVCRICYEGRPRGRRRPNPTCALHHHRLRHGHCLSRPAGNEAGVDKTRLRRLHRVRPALCGERRRCASSTGTTTGDRPWSRLGARVDCEHGGGHDHEARAAAAAALTGRVACSGTSGGPGTGASSSEVDHRGVRCVLVVDSEVVTPYCGRGTPSRTTSPSVVPGPAVPAVGRHIRTAPRRPGSCDGSWRVSDRTESVVVGHNRL